MSALALILVCFTFFLCGWGMGWEVRTHLAERDEERRNP